MSLRLVQFAKFLSTWIWLMRLTSYFCACVTSQPLSSVKRGWCIALALLRTIFKPSFLEKKAGKSSLILEKTRHGATILADDLLMWLPNKTEFLYLGLTIRMRHPVVGWEEHSKKKSELIGVKQNACAQKDVFKIQSIGV